MKFTAVFAALACATSSVVNAASISILDVYVPPITSPTSTTVWKVGAVETVTWDASNPPEHISNGADVRLLGGSLTSSVSLASGFDLTTGSVAVTVPSDIAAGTYTITLFGDSGNVSDPFEIVA